MDSALENQSDCVSEESSYYGDDDLVERLQERDRSRQEDINRELRGLFVPKFSPPNATLRLRDEPATSDNQPISQSRLELTPPGITTDTDQKLSIHHDEYPRLGYPGTRSPDETIDDFLSRLPVSDPSTAKVGPWLWVTDLTEQSRQIARPHAASIGTFIERGMKTLREFESTRMDIEEQYPSQSPAAITRRLSPYRKELQRDIFELAKRTGTTCGKWMLFPDKAELPRVWKIVAENTAAGHLGPTSKAGTYDPTRDSTLICVYTFDFTDVADLKRVLNRLVSLGLCSPTGRPLYYKCDAYTYLGIDSNNVYKLRASLYSSKDILGII